MKDKQSLYKGFGKEKQRKQGHSRLRGKITGVIERKTNQNMKERMLTDRVSFFMTSSQPW